MNFLKQNVLRQGGPMGRFEWFGVIPNETLLEDILKPGWWLHYASGHTMLKPFQIVELVTEDMMLDIEVRVISVKDNLVYVRPLRIFESESRAGLREAVRQAETANASTADLPDYLAGDYKIGFSPKAKWYVNLKKAGTTVKSGLATKADAVAYVLAHAKAAGIEAPQEQVAA